MNLNNLPNVIGAQRQLLKAIDDANISDEDMLKLSELDPEFKKYASVIAYVYNKIDPADIKPWSEINAVTDTEKPEKNETKQEWIPATKLRNMYPLAYSFLKNRSDLSASVKEEIWDIFKKDYPEYKISEDEFYRLMRLVINITRNFNKTENVEKEEEKPTPTEKTTEPVITETVSPQEILDKAKLCRPSNHTTEDVQNNKNKSSKPKVSLKDPETLKREYSVHFNWLKNQQLEYLKKNTVTNIKKDFVKRNPAASFCGRTYFGSLIKLAINTKDDHVSSAQQPEPIGEAKVYPKNPNVRFFRNGAVQVMGNDGNWTTRKITINGGYAVLSFKGKTISIAKGMLETFKPTQFPDGKLHVPYYKDGNKLNCHIDNLSWDLPNTKPSAKEIHEACEIIAKNPTASTQEWLAIMAKNGKGVQNHALDSILKGEYTSISEKYFTLQNGRPIVKIKEAKKTEDSKVSVNDGTSVKNEISSVDKLVDTINYKKLMEDRRGDVLSYFKATKNLRMAIKAFEAKMELKMTIDASDKIIPVLEFSLDKDGNIRNAGDILKDITRKYGNLYITQNYVKDILSGKIGKEYSDLVFNK